MKKNKILLAVILVIILGLLIKYRYNIGKYLGKKERFKAAKEIRTFYLYKGTNKNKVYFDSDNKRLVTNSQKNLISYNELIPSSNHLSTNKDPRVSSSVF